MKVCLAECGGYEMAVKRYQVTMDISYDDLFSLTARLPKEEWRQLIALGVSDARASDKLKILWIIAKALEEKGDGCLDHH